MRSEQPGNLPARTVYDITGEGRKELLALRDDTLPKLGEPGIGAPSPGSRPGGCPAGTRNTRPGPAAG